MAKDTAGAGYAYLPYEIDALDRTNFAVGVWIRLDASPTSGSNNAQERNRVIWSTLPPGACDSSTPKTTGNNLHDDIAGMELSIHEDRVKLSYVATNGSCQSAVSAIQNKIKHGEWNHVGVIVTDERIGIYQNGSGVGFVNTAVGNSVRAKHSHSDPLEPPSYRPKGKMVRTFVGQRADGSDVLDGRVGLLSIFAASNELEDVVMKGLYESGRRKDAKDGQIDTASGAGRPTYFYRFDGEFSGGAKTEGEICSLVAS